MAMKECPECAKEISDDARECPNCGVFYPFGWESSCGCILIILLIVFSAVAFSYLYDRYKNREQSFNDGSSGELLVIDTSPRDTDPGKVAHEICDAMAEKVDYCSHVR